MLLLLLGQGSVGERRGGWHLWLLAHVHGLRGPAAHQSHQRRLLRPHEEHHALRPKTHRHVHRQVPRRVLQAAQPRDDALARDLEDGGAQRGVEGVHVVGVEELPEHPVDAGGGGGVCVVGWMVM